MIMKQKLHLEAAASDANDMHGLTQYNPSMQLSGPAVLAAMRVRSVLPLLVQSR